MKIRQNIRHWASKKALTTPVVGDKARSKLVDMHTRIFLDKTDESNRDEREAHLDDFFAATMDTYVAALEASFTEAEAREVTHIQANFDFFTHGWAEMMEIPADELEEHYRRYDGFFAANDITIDDPLGDFHPAGGVTDAPTTPDAMADGVFENAVAGFADDVYLDDGETISRGGDTEEPADVSLDDSPGVSGEDATADD